MARTKSAPAATSELTKPRYTGIIEYDMTGDGGSMPFGTIERGVVLINGTSPNAKVTVMSFDGVARRERGNQVDVLRRCTITGDRNTLTIHGESMRVLHELKPDDGDIWTDIIVDLSKPCADCGYA